MKLKARATGALARSTVVALSVTLLLLLSLPASVGLAAGTADEVHYTFTGANSVAFDWRGTATDIRYGPTSSYGTTATAHEPTPLPFSSSGPFQEVELTGLAAGATYHYSIGGGADQTFATAPTGSFRFDVQADVGDSTSYGTMPVIQAQVAADKPALVLVAGDLTYGNSHGQATVDQHFNDVMGWSRQAAYMPAWGNHEWDSPSSDDLRNYKGRFALPHPGTSATAPAAGCCGEDWGWFDAGGVRFVSYPEPYASGTWPEWQTKVDPVFAAAQADPSIHFIVTYGHRPAYSTGHHPGSASLAGILDAFGDKYSKYLLDLNGHSHDYERFQPIHGVTHITASGGGASLETPWTSTDPRTAFRAMHEEHVRVDVSGSSMHIEAVCGPPTSSDDMTCTQGSIMDTVTIGTGSSPPPPPPALDHIVISPASATIAAGGSQAYTAQGFDSSDRSLGDVTASTVFSIAPDGSCSGNVCTATVGGPHTVTGNESGKTSIAALAVSIVGNLVLVANPGFETNTTGWNVGRSTGVTLARVAGGHTGGWAARLTNTGTSATSCLLNDSPNWVSTTSAGTYTASIWLKGGSAATRLTVWFREYAPSGARLGRAASQITLTTTWQLVTVSYKITSPGSRLDFQAFVDSAPPGTCFYADDVTIVGS